MNSVKWVGKGSFRVLEMVTVLSLMAGQVHPIDSMHADGFGREQVWSGGNSSSVSADAGGKKWAVLVAGSYGYSNYRHQADVCHAYQIMRKGGLDDENIIVFMYDDIAFSPDNPRPGIIINKPDGDDVYHGVPKDYVGDHVNAGNLYAVILGNKSGLSGGSGKVVDSGPNDYIFIYYADHGGAGILGMPGDAEFVYAKDLIEVLKKKHEAKAYKSMLIYVEACESGSIFEGLLPNNINIYATTAANSTENSYGTYCPGQYPDPPSEFGTCLGDTYSVSWMEDSEKHDMRKETLKQQYEAVRRRSVAGDAAPYSSHVQHYGDDSLDKEVLDTYMGAHPSNSNYDPFLVSKSVSQRDADLVHFWHKFHRASFGSQEKLQLVDEIAHRRWVDDTMNRVGTLLLGREKSEEVLSGVRPAGQALVDDWVCLKAFVKAYERQCGRLGSYGMKHSRALANLCNAGVSQQQMVAASVGACSN